MKRDVDSTQIRLFYTARKLQLLRLSLGLGSWFCVHDLIFGEAFLYSFSPFKLICLRDVSGNVDAQSTAQRSKGCTCTDSVARTELKCDLYLFSGGIWSLFIRQNRQRALMRA